MKKLNETQHSMKMMWGCMAFAVLAIVLVMAASEPARYSSSRAC